MSTYYYLACKGCKDEDGDGHAYCGEDFKGDPDAIRAAARVAHLFKEVRAAGWDLWGLKDDWCRNVGLTVCFAIDHEGHSGLIIKDEYGGEHPLECYS